MRILFVYDSKKGKYLNERSLIGNVLAPGTECESVDLSSFSEMHEAYRQIYGCAAEIVITFDLAGFEMKTELNSLSYNNLTCRVIHFVCEASLASKQVLKEQLGLAHFVYLPKSVDVSHFAVTHQNLPYVGTMPDMKLEELKGWWDRERKELLL